MPCSPRGCANGLFCDFDNRCRTRLPEGALCDASFQCADELFCDFTTPLAPTCAPLRELGESCTSSPNCKSNTCLPGMCADNGFACFSSDTCNARCADDNSPCAVDSNCSAGTCTG